MDDSTIFTLGMFAFTGLLGPAILLVLFLAGRMTLRNRGGDATHRVLPRPAARLGCGLLLLVPVCAFCGVMVASVGGALHPPVITVAAPYVCDGAVETQSRNYSYKPGQQGVARNVFCIETGGNRRDITLRTVGAASVYYTLILLAAALVLWGLGRFLESRRNAAPPAGIAPQSAADLKNFLAERLRTDADIVRRTDSKADAGSLEERLKRLQALRDDSLISEEEYHAKRAEVLSDL
jgi:hypothetical protein